MSVRDRLQDAMNDLTTASDSLERLQCELRAAGSHLGEIGRHVAVARTEAQTGLMWAQAAMQLMDTSP